MAAGPQQADTVARDNLWFLAPGLTHQLGNALFVARGHAQLLATAPDVASAGQALADALARAQQGLAVLRGQMPAQREPTGIGSLLAALQDVLRVPLRDRGLGLDLRAACDEVVGDGAAFARALVAAVRLAAEAVPPGIPGTVSIQPTADGEAAVVVRLAADRGSLPFPLPWAGMVAHLQRELGDGTARVTLAEGGGIAIAAAAGATGDPTALLR